MTVSGSNFDETADSVECTMSGITGTGVIDSSSQVTCIFSTGVPVSNTEQTPTIVFKYDSDSLEKTALTGGQTITNSVQGMTGTDNLVCSFAGGCYYEI